MLVVREAGGVRRIAMGGGKRRGVIITAASMAAFAIGTAFGGLRARRKNRAKQDTTMTPVTETIVGTDALDCAICLGEMVLPRVISCGHSFCTGCLSQLLMHDSNCSNCPTCRRRIRIMNIEDLPINFAARAVIEARARQNGEIENFRNSEQQARDSLRCENSHDDPDRRLVIAYMRRSWTWFKWTAIIVTEFGAFLVSLKEVLEASPSRPRRFQALV